VAAPFFADHFPRRAVFPATLLLDTQIALGTRIAREAQGGAASADPVPVRMTHVKMRAFIVPGQQVDVRAEFAGTHDGATRISLSARDGDGKTIATARVEFAARAA
jgi:3-hydroxymyristoyl/3-hydroxydecanoyl-(acyl carrier protein) dehydratase